jgi:protein-disulfide isomerase
MEQNTPFYKKLLDFKNLPLESKIYIGTILILLIYVGSTIPLIVRAFSKTNTITVDGKTYSIENLEKEKPQIFNKYQTDLASILKESFSQFAEDKIMDLAMKDQGLKSKEEVLKKGFVVSEPSDTEIQNIYDQYKDQLGGRSLQEAKEVIRQQLVLNQERSHAQNIQKDLVKKYGVTFNIQEPPPLRMDVPEGENPSVGPKTAKVTIIEFSDFECPFCKRSQEVNKRLRDKYKDKIRWVFRDFPLEFHPDAMYAHMAANCAIPQNKYWDVFNVLFDNSGDLGKTNVDYLVTKAGLNKEQYTKCISDKKVSLESEIRSDIQEGQKFGVSGTPAFFINGIFVSGALPYEHFEEIIEKELN